MAESFLLDAWWICIYGAARHADASLHVDPRLTRRRSYGQVWPIQATLDVVGDRRHGVVERRIYSEHPLRAEYRLTRRGEALKPALIAIGNWGSTSSSTLGSGVRS